MVTALPSPIDPEAILAQLTTEERVNLLSGFDSWHTYPIERLGVPKVRVSDGPVSAVCVGVVESYSGLTSVRFDRTASEEQPVRKGGFLLDVTQY